MPQSSFFDPVVVDPLVQKLDPRFNAEYRNVYGTRFGLGVSPVSQRGSLDVQLPVGDHQRQLFFTGNAYFNPASMTGGRPDYGFKVGFSKRVAPEGITSGEAINRVLQKQFGQPISSSEPVLNASNRETFFNSLTPEQLRMLGQDMQRERRSDIDRKLGITPGAEKYGVGLGIDFGGGGEGPTSIPSAIMGSNRSSEKAFLDDYKEQLFKGSRSIGLDMAPSYQ